MWTYAKCSASRSAINMEKFETTRKGGSVHFCALVPMSVARNKAFALVALSFYLSPPGCVAVRQDVARSRDNVHRGWFAYLWLSV